MSGENAPVGGEAAPAGPDSGGFGEAAEAPEAVGTDVAQDSGPPEESFDPDRAKAKISKANAEAASLRKRLREAEEYKQKWEELENSKKSEIERATDKLTKAEQRALEAEQRAFRMEVALEKGLTTAQAKRLVGNTKEELLADADDLLASFAPKTSEAPSLPEKPREVLRGGGDPTEPPEETNPRKLAALIQRPR